MDVYLFSYIRDYVNELFKQNSKEIHVYYIFFFFYKIRLMDHLSTYLDFFPIIKMSKKISVYYFIGTKFELCSFY